MPIVFGGGDFHTKADTGARIQVVGRMSQSFVSPFSHRNIIFYDISILFFYSSLVNQSYHLFVNDNE